MLNLTDQPPKSYINCTSGQYVKDRLGTKGEELIPSSYLRLFKDSNITLLNFQIAQGRIHLDTSGQEARETQQHDMSEVLALAR